MNHSKVCVCVFLFVSCLLYFIYMRSISVPVMSSLCLYVSTRWFDVYLFPCPRERALSYREDEGEISAAMATTTTKQTQAPQ